MCTYYIHQNTDNNPIHPLNNSNISNISNSNISTSMASSTKTTKPGAPFDAFMKQRYSKKGEQHTHTRIGSEKLGIHGGAYTIAQDDIGEFYRKYTDHVFIQGASGVFDRETTPGQRAGVD